jgi:hypothetical protein
LTAVKRYGYFNRTISREFYNEISVFLRFLFYLPLNREAFRRRKKKAKTNSKASQTGGFFIMDI